jgi:hypothetical protein
MGFFSFETAWRTFQGDEMMNMLRKGQGQGVGKGDVGGQVGQVDQVDQVGQVALLTTLFGGVA